MLYQSGELCSQSKDAKSDPDASSASPIRTSIGHQMGVTCSPCWTLRPITHEFHLVCC